MTKNTTATGSTIDGVTVVHPDNMSDKSFNFENNKYEVAISKQPNNMLSMKEDGLYYGITPTRTQFFVDYLNGSDSNDGSKQAPFKTVGKAIDSVEVGTVGTQIFLKEEQRHYFKSQVGNRYDFYTNASYIIGVYGDKVDALKRDWYSTHLGYRTTETETASQAFKLIQPTLVFSGTDLPLPNDPKQLCYLEGIRVTAGNRIEVYGLKLECENTANVSNSSGGWFSSCFRGSGEVILYGCTMVQRDFENGHFYLANSTVGQLTISLRYFIIGGTGNLFSVGQYPLNVYSSYDTVTDETVETRSLTQLKYKGVARASEIFALTTESNPKSFITNK